MSVAVDEQSFLLGDWKVEPSLNRIVRGEEVVKIDPRNMQVLQLLASEPGHVFSQAEIEEAVWADVVVTPNSVYQSIAQLRRALADETRGSRYIETIARKGYRTVAPVSHSLPDVPRTETAENRSAPTRHKMSSRLPFAGSLITLSFIVTIVLAGGGLRIGSQAMNQPTSSNAGKQGIRNLSPDEALTPPASDASPRLLRDLANVALTQGRRVEARRHLLEALNIERNRLGDWHPSVGKLLSELANVSIWDYDYEAAERYARDAVSVFERMPDTHHERIVAMRQLGYTLLEAGKYEEAESFLTRSLAQSKRAFADTEWNTTAILNSDLAVLRYSQGRLDEAENFARQSLHLLRQIFDDELRISGVSVMLTAILIAQERFAEAKQEAEGNLAMLHALFAEDHVYIVSTRDLLAQSLMGLREHQAAEDVLRRNIDLWQRNDMRQRAAASLSALGEALLGQGRIVEAENCLMRASTEIDGTSTARQEQQLFREHRARLDKLHLMKARLSAGGPHFADAGEQ